MTEWERPYITNPFKSMVNDSCAFANRQEFTCSEKQSVCETAKS